MSSRNAGTLLYLTVLMLVAAIPATSQSFRVQCPTSTITHPSSLTNVNAEPAYNGPTTLATTAGGYLAPSGKVNGAIKCQQISGGDGYATMGDGTQTYMFSFGPLSGLADIANGLPGTQFPNVFNTPYSGANPCSPAILRPLAFSGFTYNGAVGQVMDADASADGLCGGPVNPRASMATSIRARSWTWV